MSHKAIEDESNVLPEKDVPNMESKLSDTLGQLKAKILEQDRELQDVRKNNKKLEKRNKNLKESIQKLIEDKRHIEDLCKIIDDQNLKIQEYEKKEAGAIVQTVSAENDNDKENVEKNLPAPSPTQAVKPKTGEQPVLSKQIQLLTFKNQELKAELDRRTRISDQLRKEHETILNDRNELLFEVKTLKQQVEGMKQRLDRSFSLLSKKRTSPRDTNVPSESTSTNPPVPSLNSSKGIQNRKEKSPTKTASVFQDKRTSNGRLILNSVGKMLQRESRIRGTKTNRVTASKIPVPIKDKSMHRRNYKENTLEMSKAKEKSTEARRAKENAVELPKVTEKAVEPPAMATYQMEASGSVQEVMEKRVVTDIRAKLEKNNTNQEAAANLKTPEPTSEVFTI